MVVVQKVGSDGTYESRSGQGGSQLQLGRSGLECEGGQVWLHQVPSGIKKGSLLKDSMLYNIIF